MDPQNDFFTLQSLATFAGAVGATTVVANGCQRAFHFNPAWFALVLAEAICIIVVVFAHSNAPQGTTPPISDYFVAAVNGFLVFCSAAGATGLGGRVVGDGPPTPPSAKERGVGGMYETSRKRRFFSPWF